MDEAEWIKQMLDWEEWVAVNGSNSTTTGPAGGERG